jgi:hypothetical protein
VAGILRPGETAPALREIPNEPAVIRRLFARHEAGGTGQGVLRGGCVEDYVFESDPRFIARIESLRKGLPPKGRHAAAGSARSAARSTDGMISIST